MNVNTDTNYLTNSLVAAKQFAGNVATALRENLYQSKYGYGSKGGSVLGNIKNIAVDPAKSVATAVGDVLTNQTQRQVWKYTNVPRVAAEVGERIARSSGVDPVTGAVMAAAAPLALMSLSNVRGPISQGLRPAGYRAVAPKSEEEDPTGRTPQSVPLEFALRSVLGQRSQLLPYQEFAKERPDVAPSTYSQYRRYERAKPQPGQLLSIDPEGQSFTTVGGLIRGTAKGLNDPEIRIKGMPITASGLLGTVAGLGTAAAAYKMLPQEMRKARLMQSTSYAPEVQAERAQIESRLAPVENKQLKLKQIVRRIQGEMQAKGVRPLDKYGTSPDDQAALRVHKETLLNRANLNKLTDDINKYTYAHGRATGKIPEPPVTQTEEGQQPRESLKRQTRIRVKAGLEPKDVSFSPSDQNISYLEDKIANLTSKKEQLLGKMKSGLEALNISEKALNLQERLTRAKFKAGELSSQASDLQSDLRATYRPVNVETPSTATIAGLALAGTAAAVGTAYVAKKLFQKSAERRIKRENPVEYLKYKHGSLEQAKANLQQPGARSWQELAPYVM